MFTGFGNMDMEAYDLEQLKQEDDKKVKEVPPLIHSKV